MFVQLLANGLVTGSVIALAAAGVSIVYGILRLVNFAYGDYMTFGAFMGILFNVTLDLPIVPAAMLAMAATAVLSVALELVLWRPLRARSAGFMSLFLVSVGLALVLRHVIYLAAGPQPRTYAVDPYKVYVIGSARLSGAQGIAIVVAAVGIDAPDFVCCAAANRSGDAAELGHEITLDVAGIEPADDDDRVARSPLGRGIQPIQDVLDVASQVDTGGRERPTRACPGHC